MRSDEQERARLHDRPRPDAAETLALVLLTVVLGALAAVMLW
jgi:hypothetical protein